MGSENPQTSIVRKAAHTATNPGLDTRKSLSKISLTGKFLQFHHSLSFANIPLRRGAHSVEELRAARREHRAKLFSRSME